MGNWLGMAMTYQHDTKGSVEYLSQGSCSGIGVHDETDNESYCRPQQPRDCVGVDLGPLDLLSVDLGEAGIDNGYTTTQDQLV